MVFKLYEYDKELYNQFKDIDDWGDEEFIELVLNNIQRLFPKRTFVHEFVHFLDFISQPDGVWDKDRYDKPTNDESKYINNFKEIQANMMEGFVDYRNDIKRGKYQTFEEFEESFIDYVFDDYWEKFTIENKKRIRKRMYSFWRDLIDNNFLNKGLT